MKSLTDLLHILLCTKKHCSDMMDILDRKDGVCYYYLEDQIDDGHCMPDHLLWAENTEGFKASLNFPSDGEAMTFLKEVMQLSHRLQTLSGGDRARAAFIKSILDL